MSPHVGPTLGPQRGAWGGHHRSAGNLSLPWAAKMGDASFPRGPTAWSQGPLRLQDIRGSSPFSDIELFWDLWIPWLPWPLSFSFSANSVSPLGVGLWWGWEPLQPFPSLGLCLGAPPHARDPRPLFSSLPTQGNPF